ncbi:MAG: AAA-like domain-containing protein [Stigonema ocellatum SAG 48.90 = DSM 106950]|nr:AAA-like domain-containing protein [Stigonema ocellatum SAG 48.90 = DSM 106950]
MQKILVLAAIPQGLRLDKEIRDIVEAIRRGVRRDLFKIEVRTAVRPQDIRRAIAEERPQIVHFCGHGQEDGSLVLEDDGGNHKPVSSLGLAALFKLHTDYVKCVLLNACYSALPAEAISQHINYVIGMNQPIGDKAAIVFAVGFYDGLGYENPESQKVIQRAFDEGIVAIQMEDSYSGQIPVLKKRLFGIENLTPEPATIYTEQETPGNNIYHSYPVMELEYPDGYVPLNSPFYIELQGIESVYEALLKPASLIRIKAPKLMGKTSLMMRIIAYGQKQYFQSVYLDLGGIDKAVLINLDRFLRWLCGRVSDELLKQALVFAAQSQANQQLYNVQSQAEQQLKRLKDADEKLKDAEQEIEKSKTNLDAAEAEKEAKDFKDLQIQVLFYKIQGSLLAQKNENHQAIKSYTKAFNILKQHPKETDFTQDNQFVTAENIASVHRGLIELLSKNNTELELRKEVEKSLTQHLYTQLKYSFNAKNWKAADIQTSGLMLNIAKREKEGFLDYDQINSFSCPDLKKIDQLWFDNSNKRFGFRVQKEIWRHTGNRLGIKPEDWTSKDSENYLRFAKEVGWYNDKKTKDAEAGGSRGDGWIVSYEELLEGIKRNPSLSELRRTVGRYKT